MSSHRTTLSLVNFSGRDIRTTEVLDLDPHDWDYEPPHRTRRWRPDLNFTGPLANGDARCEREEINAAATGGANFTLKCTFDNGESIQFHVNQRDALSKHDGRVPAEQSRGGAALKVHRVTGEAADAYTQAFYLRPPAAPDHSGWMGRLLESKPDVTVNEITMPGSHDAGMYADNRDQVSLGASREGGAEWAVTQHLTIARQLRAGARYFDLRVYHDRAGELWSYHGQFKGAIYYGGFGGRFDDILDDVAQFLDGPGSTEAVFLKVVPYDGAADLRKTVDMIAARLGSRLYKARLEPGFAGTKLADLQGKAVVACDPLFSGHFSARDGIFHYRECGDPDTGAFVNAPTGGLRVYDVYADSNSFREMRLDQDGKLTSHGGYGKAHLFLFSWTLTGHTGGILDLELLSRSANPQLPRELRRLVAAGRPLPNIVHIDHVDPFLCGAIIALNEPAPASSAPDPTVLTMNA